MTTTLSDRRRILVASLFTYMMRSNDVTGFKILQKKDEVGIEVGIIPPCFSFHVEDIPKAFADSGRKNKDGRDIKGDNREAKGTKRTAAGIPTWSPTVVLICRSTAYVWQSGRDAQFSADCGRTCWVVKFLRS